MILTHSLDVCLTLVSAPRQSIVTIEDGKLVHIQRWDGKETSLVREVNGNVLLLVSNPPPSKKKKNNSNSNLTSVCMCM